MKHTATIEDASHSLENTVLTLKKHFTNVNQSDSESIKLANEYYKWTALKTDLIMRSVSLVRKAVVWVDFGYNIGTEFGGRHPAIILKNLKDSLIVIPLSSQQPKSMEYNVKVEKVYGYPLMNRWANVTRITQVSLSRVHFEKIGDVKPFVLAEISQKLNQCGIV